MAKENKKIDPVLAHEDEESILAHKQLIKADVFQPLEKAVEEFNALNIGQLTTADLRPLVESPKEVVKQKCVALISDMPSYGPFQVNKQKLVDTLELPNLFALTEAIDNFHKKLHKSRTPLDILRFYEMKEGKLAVNEAALQQRIEGARVYAVSENEQAILKAYNAFLVAYKELDSEIKRRIPAGLRHFRAEMFVKENNRGELVFNPMFYNSLVSGSTF